MTRAMALIAAAFTVGTAAFVVLLVHVAKHPSQFLPDLALLAGACALVVGAVVAAWRRRPAGPQTAAEVYEMGYEHANRR